MKIREKARLLESIEAELNEIAEWGKPESVTFENDMDEEYLPGESGATFTFNAWHSYVDGLKRKRRRILAQFRAIDRKELGKRYEGS